MTEGGANPYFQQLGMHGLDEAIKRKAGKREEMINAMCAGLAPTSLAEAAAMRRAMEQAVSQMGDLGDDAPSRGDAASWDIPAKLKSGDCAINPEAFRRTGSAAAPGDAVACAHCGKAGPVADSAGAAGHKRCARCRSVHYCGPDCQKAHWPAHKTACAPVKAS